MPKEKDKTKISESFIVGVIAVVFLMIGYQTALFIHNAAVTKIAANRDKPDTVYVYETQSVEEYSSSVGPGFPNTASSGGSGSSTRRTERKVSSHPPRAEAVRKKLPRPRVETFRFDPNTVSVEDLCRLGFSHKQAQSIDNYRNKGGRFRRKSDFAKSFVVSDSIYKRLEPYIDIPLVDLNLADSAAFDALPGIGGWFAKKIIDHREALKGYSYKEQLMDIYNFDRERFEGLSDLVIVDSSAVTPYPLWTLPIDSLRKHPYIRDYETARAIVLFRENSPRENLTVQKMIEAGIFTAETAKKMSGCVIAKPDSGGS